MLMVEGPTISVDIILVDSLTGGVGNGVILDDNSTLVEVGNIGMLTVLSVTVLVILKDCVGSKLVVIVKLASVEELVEVSIVERFVDDGVMLGDNVILREAEVVSNVETVVVLTVPGMNTVDWVILRNCVRFMLVVKLTPPKELVGVTIAEVKLVVEGVITSVDIVLMDSGGVDNEAILDDNAMLVVDTVLALTVLGTTRVDSAVLNDRVGFTLKVVVNLTSLKELEAETAELRDEVKLMTEGVTVSVDIVLLDSFTGGEDNGATLDDNSTLVAVERVLVLTVLGTTRVVVSVTLKDCMTSILVVVVIAENVTISVDVMLAVGGVDNGGILDDNVTLVEVEVISNVEMVLALTVLTTKVL